MAPSKFQVKEYADHKKPAPASPSASIILVSPNSEILLLHRVHTSSAFPSAHVFPGGNLEKSDGALPEDPKDVGRHREGLAYRTGAIRELFEETGILLARADKNDKTKGLLSVNDHDRRQGRKAIHDGQVPLSTWLAQQSADAVLDTDGLIPFTHWVTPPNVPKRFSTQMYLYFVHVEEAGNPSVHATSDEIETMAPEWRRAKDWLERARSGEVILFPPQFLLLYLISEILDVEPRPQTREEIKARRVALRRFIQTDGDPAWTDKYISPIGMQVGRPDGRAVLRLDRPGPELKDSGLKGESQRVVLVRFRKEGPRDVEVGFWQDVLGNVKSNEPKNSRL